MKRTHAYLTQDELSALARVERETGIDQAELIRRANDREYVARVRMPKTDRLRAINIAAGAWKRRSETGADYVERLWSGRLERLHARGRRRDA